LALAGCASKTVVDTIKNERKASFMWAHTPEKRERLHSL